MLQRPTLSSFKKSESVFWMIIQLFKNYFNPVSFRSSIAPLQFYDYLNEHKGKTGFPFKSPLDFIYMCIHLMTRELAKMESRFMKKVKKKMKKQDEGDIKLKVRNINILTFDLLFI
jgi:hypothetical protein